ncbi:uncharacterized protein LOC120359587 [Solenopsis invicta]|uniref:uncharacterized protein LOC120359587 n=1 Tax=Solenopsis invicta TaxID=13686 RepID=UPI00193D2306|nr:uncharacterized protein LOC120359587 [Solenopsis invicta]
MASKKLSGSANRKRKLRWEEEENKSAKSLAAFFKPQSDCNSNFSQNVTTNLTSEINKENSIHECSTASNAEMHIISDNLDSQESNLKIVVEEPVASSSSGLVELLGKYDVTMHEHFRRISSQETHVHYCSNTIQNEIITLMGSNVKNTILDRARQAKYYSIIDCTPDLSHTEQLSVTIRFVDVSSDVSPKEHFITFRAVHESSASVGRWKILTDTVPAFTVPLCTTRWESRIECLKPLRYQVIEIHDALLTLSEHGSSDPAIKHEAQTLASQLCDYNFLVMLVIWYDILFRINIVSKSMQSNTMDLGSAVSLMESYAEYIENYRLNGFAKALVDAKELAKSLDVDPIFVQKRVNRKKRMFNYEHSDETMSDPQNLFKTKIFYVILDTAITSLKERFKQLKEFQDT